jgi:hypothetical protein
MVVVQVDAMNLHGIVNKGSPRLALNILARELFWVLPIKYNRLVNRMGP